MTVMRAKLRVGHVWENHDNDGKVVSEQLTFNAVSRSDQYPEDGSDENNTFSRFSPSATFQIYVANPALFGKFTIGEEYYVDFTKVE
jgi:hypothetical protein